MMQAHRNGLALAATFAVLYIACALLTVLWPGLIFGTAASWAHAILLTPNTSTTWASFLYGLVTFAIFGYICGVLFSVTANALRHS